jgi:AraC-like DNA-binding protein
VVSAAADLAAAPGAWQVAAQKVTELDEIRAAVTGSIEPHDVERIGQAKPLDAHHRFGEIGGLRLVQLRYGADVLIIRPETQASSGVLVETVLTGYSEVTIGRQSTVSTPILATVLTPHRRARIHYAPDCEKIVLRIDRHKLARHCEALLGRELRHPLEFELGFDLTDGAGRDWLQLMHHMQAAIEQENLLLRSPLAAAQFEQLVMTTLLLGQPHNHSELFQQPHTMLAPFYVKRAEAYIEANLDQPLSMAELAAQAGVSARSLQTGFQQFRGTTPTAYLRELRLKRVHEALLSADPQRSSVTDIALQWGFGHLGKFSVAYKQRFGESPSTTFRRWR